jgi:hypothetical protein
MGAITTTRNDLSEILLVACDQSYWGGPNTNTPSKYGPITDGTVLAQYLDSLGPKADQWPSTMPPGLKGSASLNFYE